MGDLTLAIQPLRGRWAPSTRQVRPASLSATAKGAQSSAIAPRRHLWRSTPPEARMAAEDSAGSGLTPPGPTERPEGERISLKALGADRTLEL